MSNWVSSKEQLPTDCVDVLLYNQTNHEQTVGWWSEEYQCFTAANGAYNLNREEVPYWQDLPEPPQGTKWIEDIYTDNFKCPYCGMMVPENGYGGCDYPHCPYCAKDVQPVTERTK